MHDAVVVDFLEPPREADHELLDLPQRELPRALVDPAVQLSRREQLQDDVQGVVGLEHALQFDGVW